MPLETTAMKAGSMLLPPEDELARVFRDKHGDLDRTGWGPRLRARFGYYTPDDVYEALVARLVKNETRWLDVGGGRDIFPGNPKLALQLAQRAKLVVAVDPSDNVLENNFVHERVKSTIEDYRPGEPFDLITLRMVAEHLTDPESAVRSLARAVAPGGLVVVYTVNKWSAITGLSWITPLWMHHVLKREFWGAEERDTFEVAYRMNTRRDLNRAFSAFEFVEREVDYPADCRIFTRWKLGNTLELSLWRALRGLGLPHMETCLLAIYQMRSR